MNKFAETVSPDLQNVLDHLAGISDELADKAVAEQMAALHAPGPGNAHPLGMWFGGCYYVRTYHKGPGVQTGASGRLWRRVYCVA